MRLSALYKNCSRQIAPPYDKIRGEHRFRVNDAASRAQLAATLAEPIKLYESLRGESPRRENGAQALKETIYDVVRSPRGDCFARTRHTA